MSSTDTAGSTSFRSFWTAPPQNPAHQTGGMYDYQGSNTNQSTSSNQHNHSHAHSYTDDNIHGHSHGSSNISQREDTPLLSSSTSRDDRINIRTIFRSPAVACVGILIFLLLLIGILYFFDPFGSTSVLVNSLTPGSSVASIAAVCNPFALYPLGIDWSHNHGIVAKLFVLPPEMRDMAGKISDYEKLTIATNLTFFFSKIDTPTRLFTDVFSYVKEDENNKQELLLPAEYFLLDLYTRIKLRPSDSLGPYQFALISDDSSILTLEQSNQRKNNSQEEKKPSPIVNNDGIHSTRIAVSNKPFSFPFLSSYVDAHFQYVQGPPAHIAFVALWRLWDYSDDQDKAPDTESSDNDLFWTINNINQTKPSQPNERYEKLLSDGWSVIPDEVFYLPESYDKKDQVAVLLAEGLNPCNDL